ncbi:MAG TPA: MBOAT family protein [Firmicutes bacterium]|nr:MBOAT family protein [Bacillota bacterium]
MVFSSLSFLFLFFPVTFLLYAAVPFAKFRNALLILASLVFYAWGEPVYILLLLASVVLNWLLALALGRRDTGRKAVAAAAVILNIGLLVVFKYSGFLTETANALFRLSLPVPAIRLPIGISFFTFQTLSYVIDVYRDKSSMQKSLPRLLLYISFFPQLIAGPIVKYHDIKDQLERRTFSFDRCAGGFRRFLYGLAKKVLIANVMAVTADYAFGLPAASLTAPAAWLGAVSYMLQIYFDFSGYSDMAIGLGKAFGFDFKENFRYPYAAVGIKDFWRKWHISLSTWFKEYLYIPLGGNRKGKARTYLNQLIVFACTGLWHGANVTFLVWGLFHGLFLILESAGILPVRKAEKHPAARFLARVYTLFVVLVGFTVFRADTMTQAVQYLGAMFTGGPGAAADAAGALAYLTPWFLFVLAIACVVSFPVAPALESRLCRSAAGATAYAAVSYGLSLALFALCILSLAADTYNPFIYFRF